MLIRHPSVNELHARIIMDDKGGEIEDFNSEYGVFINDKRVERGRFVLGDRVRIGAVKLILLEYEDEQEQSYESSQTLSLTGVSLSMMKSSSQKAESGPSLQLIDGEYCDIVFDDSKFAPLDTLPTSQQGFGPRDYIDFVS